MRELDYHICEIGEISQKMASINEWINWFGFGRNLVLKNTEMRTNRAV